jgi:hypothetical protein
MAKKKRSSEGGRDEDSALARVSADEGISALLARRGDPSGVSEMTREGVAIVRRGDSMIPTDAHAIVTAGSKDHASQEAEAQAHRAKVGEIISVREGIKAELSGQVDQLHAALRAKDAEIERITVEFTKLRDENRRLLSERAGAKHDHRLLGAGEPLKKKKKKQPVGFNSRSM